MEEGSIIQYSFYGLPVSDISERSLIGYFQYVVNNSKKKIIYGYSLYAIYALNRIPEIYTLGSQADIFLTDGRPFYWFCKLSGIHISQGISIPECVMLTLKFANENHLKVMLVGSTLENNELAYRNIRFKFKNVEMVEGHHGFFNDDDETKIIEKISTSEPDILLVGMSSPKKEIFVFKNKSVLAAKIIIPCGGMIDVLAGKTKMTPSWIKKMGLAFVFRIIQEPGRLFFDRMKMLFFLFTNFFPILIVNRIVNRKNFSIPDYYIKTK